MDAFAQAVLAWAVSKLGVTETAQNSGPEIDQWLKDLGGKPGDPWCAAFVCEALVRAHEGGAGDSGIVGSLSTQRLWMRNADRQVHDPAPGYVYILRHSATSGNAGFIETVENGMVASEISGNTFGDKGGREGTTVARHFGSPEKTHGGMLLGFLRVGG